MANKLTVFKIYIQSVLYYKCKYCYKDLCYIHCFGELFVLWGPSDRVRSPFNFLLYWWGFVGPAGRCWWRELWCFCSITDWFLSLLLPLLHRGQVLPQQAAVCAVHSVSPSGKKWETSLLIFTIYPLFVRILFYLFSCFEEEGVMFC